MDIIYTDTYWKRQTNMDENLNSQFSRTTTGIQAGQNILMKSISAMTFLPNCRITVILYSFRLVQEKKEGQKILSHQNYSS